MANTPGMGRDAERPSLVDVLDQNFALYHANTAELQDTCHRLRYETYCLDNPYESSAEQFDGLERDWYDTIAEHALVVHRASNLAVGTVRLVLPGLMEPPQELPFQRHCGYRDPISRGQVPLQTAAEISRFGVPRRVRGLLREASGLSEDATLELRTRDDLAHGLPILMLIRGFLMLSAGHQISHLCAMMEPSLLRRVARLGIYFDRAGPAIDYHGLRQPSIISLNEMLSRVWRLRPDVWQAITARGRLPYDKIPLIAAE